LGELVESLPAAQPVIIIAHSLGTMVSRYYIERLGGSARVERAILMGGPHLGTPKILTSMLIAPEVLPFGIMGERLRQIILTFPSNYQIIPIYDVGTDQHGSKINFLKDESWIAPEYLPLLRQGRKFRRELGGLQGFPYVSIFGYGMKTVSNVVLSRDANGGIQKVDYVNGTAGDDSILEQSAFLQGSEIHPVRQHHGALFVDNDVKMRLKLELSRP
jgi:pimeloyl-ACP methyl ester carboxylesterase